MVDIAHEFGVSTLMMCLFFGTNFFLFLIFQALRFYAKPTEEKATGKVLSKPFTGTIDCFTNLTAELFRTGLIMALTYICEKHWFFDHSTKSYNRDLFIFVLIIFFAYAFYTVKPIHDLSLLGREQTEEWKGWMQFIFLLYHYFHAEEVYNSVRVMITCYVWMTGFGNFSFFYIKQDFSWLRVMQMMWRLNFSVLLLMWTHGNTYILYYICPMHTFYFMMVYVTMAIFSEVNNTKWGIRFKLLALGVIIFIIWDINGGIFDFLFAFLGTDKVIGASQGSVWEYYFRTSLDHWSSFLGMIFALNFPLAEQFFVKAKGGPLIVAAIAFAGLFYWWLTNCYMLEKIDYNLTHSYFAIIPLTAYIFFRNITPYVRSGVSQSLHELGKTTLETYLLQHHIWLTSNAKTLLTITPNHPWINFALCTMLFFVVSKELYRITLSLRGMVLPDDKNIAFINMIACVVIVLAVGALAFFLHAFQPSSLEIVIACVGLTLTVLLIINRFTRNFSENSAYQQVSRRAVFLLGSLLALGIVGQLLLNTVETLDAPIVGAALPLEKKYIGNTRACLDSLSTGHWEVKDCPLVTPTTTTTTTTSTATATFDKSALCETHQWIWNSNECPVGKLTVSKARAVFKGKKINFIGDSEMRNVYHQFIHVMDPNYTDPRSASLKHSDLQYIPSFDKNATVAFTWAPFLSNATAAYKQSFFNGKSKYDVIVLGTALWDALYNHDVTSYESDLNRFSADITNSTQYSQKDLITMWILPTTINDARLSTQDKKDYMNEKVVSSYRMAFKRSQVNTGGAMKVVIDPTSVSSTREDSAVDGVHYSEDVYSVIAQMVSNGYSLQFPQNYAAPKKAVKPYQPKPTGSMSLPWHGAGILAVSFVMLFLMDAYLGVGFLALLLFGRFYDWEAAYVPLHKKLFGSGGGVQMTNTKHNRKESGNDDVESEGLLEKKSEA